MQKKIIRKKVPSRPYSAAQIKKNRSRNWQAEDAAKGAEIARKARLKRDKVEGYVKKKRARPSRKKK